MREIKFRGKDRKGNWRYGYYHYGIMYPNDSQNHYIDNEIIDVSTVGQYTGLKDANGVEIYEGDIIQSKEGTISFVVWCLDGYRANSFFDGYADLFFCINKAEAKVIGNMTDNPELLNA